MGKTLSTPDVNTNSEQEHDRTKSHDSPSQGSDSLLTDNVINGIESHLSTIQGSVRKMRGKNLREAEKKLINAISDTEKKLTDLKQQLQLEEKRFGKSKFYVQHDEDDDNSDNVDTTVTQLDELRLENENLHEMLADEEKKRVKEEAKNVRPLSFQIEKLRLDNEDLCEKLREEKEKRENVEAKNVRTLLPQIDKLRFENENYREIVREEKMKREKEAQNVRALSLQIYKLRLENKDLRDMLRKEKEKREKEETMNFSTLLPQIENLQLENKNLHEMLTEEKEKTKHEHVNALLPQLGTLLLKNKSLLELLREEKEKREQEAKTVSTILPQIDKLRLENKNLHEMLTEEKQKREKEEAKNVSTLLPQIGKLRHENKKLRAQLRKEIEKREKEEEKNVRTLLPQIDKLRLENKNLNEMLKEEKEKREKEEAKNVRTLLPQISKLRLENENLCEMLRKEKEKREQEKAKNASTLFLQIEKLRLENENLRAQLWEKKEKNLKEEEKNKNKCPRLGEVARWWLVENSTGIPELSDPNRPTKLGEMHSELYDNEWTEALKDLKAEGYDEENAILMLLFTFINAFDFCKLKADSMLVKTERAMSLVFEDFKLIPEPKSSYIKYHETSPDIKLHVGRRKELKGEDAQQSLELPEKMSEAIENKIKALRRETAEIMVPVVQKAYLETLKTEELVPALMPFIRKCIFLSWMMVVQSPPMCIHEVEMREHLKFDKNYFKEYTASGPMVKYFVWPALLLHENGPVVCKGIAQGC